MSELETKPKATAEPMVSMKQADLDELMKRLARVEYAADKGHLAVFDNKNKEEITRTLDIPYLEGKRVVSWSDLITNYVEKSPSGSWVEDQTTRIKFEDETEMEVTYSAFARNVKFKECPILKISKEESAEGTKTFYTVRLPDGKETVYNSTFVN